MKQMMDIVFAVDRNWNIGYDGDMLFKISNDLKRFKEITFGHVLVMGRKTFVSLPGSKPLPGREHIVLTRDTNFQAEGVTIVHSIPEMDALLEQMALEGKKFFLIGGGDLTTQLIDRVRIAYITKVDRAFYPADAFLPNFDEIDDFEITYKSEWMRDDAGLDYQYVNYERKNA